MTWHFGGKQWKGMGAIAAGVARVLPMSMEQVGLRLLSKFSWLRQLCKAHNPFGTKSFQGKFSRSYCNRSRMKSTC
jgi:hypothetical protein